MVFPLKLVMWGAEQLLAVASSAGSLLHSFACPLHCGGSSVPWFLSGVCLGFTLCLVLLGFLWVNWTSLDFPRHSSASPAHHPGRGSTVPPRRRLSAYLE